MLETAEDFAALLEDFGEFLSAPWYPSATLLAAQQNAAGVEAAPSKPCR